MNISLSFYRQLNRCGGSNTNRMLYLGGVKVWENEFLPVWTSVSIRDLEKRISNCVSANRSIAPSANRSRSEIICAIGPFHLFIIFRRSSDDARTKNDLISMARLSLDDSNVDLKKKQNKHTPNISHFSCKCIRVVLACIFHTHLLIGHYSVSLFIFGIRMQSKKLKLSYSTHVHMFTCSNTAPKTAIFAKESKDASNIDRRPKSFWTKFKITHLVLFFCFARSSTDLRRRFHRFWRNCHFLFLSFLCLSIMSFTHLLGQATAFAYWPSWSASECVYWTHHILV